MTTCETRDWAESVDEAVDESEGFANFVSEHAKHTNFTSPVSIFNMAPLLYFSERRVSEQLNLLQMEQQKKYLCRSNVKSLCPSSIMSKYFH